MRVAKEYVWTGVRVVLGALMALALVSIVVIVYGAEESVSIYETERPGETIKVEEEVERGEPEVKVADITVPEQEMEAIRKRLPIEEKPEAAMAFVVAEPELDIKEVPMAISNTYSDTTVRLNTEAYEIAASILSASHISHCLGEPLTPLAKSYVEYITPITPIALSVCETGMYRDLHDTWGSFIYSGLLKKQGVDLSKVHVAGVDTDFYAGCGLSCVGSGAYNDGSSLGCLQILRQYVADSSVYACGNVCSDLLSWEDNCEFLLHEEGNVFFREQSWLKDYCFNSPYEVMAVQALIHNTGTSCVAAKDCSTSMTSSRWRTYQNAVEFALELAQEENILELKKFVNKWYEYWCEQGDTWSYAGLAGESSYYQTVAGYTLSGLLNELSLDMSAYIQPGQVPGVKQYYILKALLNYLSLEQLYYSGR